MENEYPGWRNHVIKIDEVSSELTPEMVLAFQKKICEAEEKFVRTFNEQLFAGGPTENYVPITLTRFELFKFKLVSVWYAIRCRVIGIWSVLLTGECKNCEHDDW